jgi:hypothetical protein
MLEMQQEQNETDRRHDLLLIERLVQEGRSQVEIEAALNSRGAGTDSVGQKVRRLFRRPTKQAA